MGKPFPSLSRPLPSPTTGISPKAHPHVDITRLPSTNRDVFGRVNELAWLDACWNDGVRIASIIAFGGVGKSALVNRWLQDMDEHAFRGAERVYGWSFYRQGTGGGGSSDEFFAHALEWFGDREPPLKSPYDKGERLAKLVREKRTLLVLDGLEPLQEKPQDNEAKIQDPALQALIRSLATSNHGLCLLTTRVAASDLKRFSKQNVSALDLTHLEPEAGAELLRNRGASGPEHDMRAASSEYKGHALALTMLGSYVRKAYGGDIRKRRGIPSFEGEPAQRMMATYERWFADKPELSILRMLGLFDGPAPRDELDSLRVDPPIAGLTDRLHGLLDTEWNIAETSLRDAGLVAASGADDSPDAHPLVRAYFAKQLRNEQPEAFREGHRRLYQYLKEIAKPWPDTIQEMAPLYAAVMHGCLAGKNQEALDKVYLARILRGAKHFSWGKLGAFSSEVATLSAFFEPPWERLVPGLSEPGQAFVLHEAGCALRALGRLKEAAGLIRLGLERDLARGDWNNAAIAANNISELLQVRGLLHEAVEAARHSVELADKSEDDFLRMATRTIQAAAQHAMGRREEAARLFDEAECMQMEREPKYPWLYSIRGFRYCDLLLDQGRAAEVRERAEKFFAWRVPGDHLLDVALDHLIFGRAHLVDIQRSTGGDLAEANSHMKQAVDGLRNAGHQDDLPLGLLARAALHIHTHASADARADLDEAMDLATRCGFRLHEADAHLGYVRLAIAEGNAPVAREHLEAARKIIQDTEYHRRDGEVLELENALADL